MNQLMSIAAGICLAVLHSTPLFAQGNKINASPISIQTGADSSHAEGVIFEKGLNWAQVKAKAIAEKKHLFVDVYTTWCAPCKHLDAKVFPLKEVGDYFNQRFISVKLQLDKKETDSEEIKRWYAEADSLGKLYEIKSLPTFLFFDPSGELVHRMVGAGDPVPEFMARIAEAFDPEKQFYTLIKNFESSDKSDLNQIKKLALASRKASSARHAAQFADLYIKNYDKPLDVATIAFASDFNKSINGQPYKLFATRAKEVDQVMGEGYATIQVMNILMPHEYYGNTLFKEATVNWNTVEKRFKKQYGAHAEQLLSMIKVEYASDKKQYEQFAALVEKHVEKYFTSTSLDYLNSYAWTIHRHLPLGPLTQKALTWSDYVIGKEYNYVLLSTYGNLLYKLGRTKQAIHTMENMVSMVEVERKSLFERDLKKMQNGEKTWYVD